MRKGIFKWAVLILLFSLIMGGRPWPFPDGGRLWLKALRSNSNHVPQQSQSDHHFHSSTQTINK